MEEAFELNNYLPLSFKSPKEQEYIDFLWDAFDTNYSHDKYQFAFLAYHMLTMSFVYFNIWQIRQARPEDFEKGLIGFAETKRTCWTRLRRLPSASFLSAPCCASSSSSPATTAKSAPTPSWWTTETRPPTQTAIFFQLTGSPRQKDHRDPARGARNPKSLNTRHRTLLSRVPASKP